MHNLLHWRLLVALPSPTAATITQAAALCGMTQCRQPGHRSTGDNAEHPALVRQPHNVVLTQSGLQIVTHARTMLEALRAIQQCAQQASNARTRAKYATSFPSAFSKLLPPLLLRISPSVPRH